MDDIIQLLPCPMGTHSHRLFIRVGIIIIVNPILHGELPIQLWSQKFEEIFKKASKIKSLDSPIAIRPDKGLLHPFIIKIYLLRFHAKKQFVTIMQIYDYLTSI